MAEGDDEHLDPYPELPRGTSEGVSEAPLATASWFDVDELERQSEIGERFAHVSGQLWLGRTPTQSALPVGWLDDRHVVTIAGSRAGKGVSAIIPVLCDYPGSIVCIDPKGENARRTVKRRGFGSHTPFIEPMHQEVFVLDPYRVSGLDDYYATFDPLIGLGPHGERTQEEAGLIADALVVPANDKDAHWDDSARSLIEAIILHVLSWSQFDGNRTLGKVHKLLRDGDRDELAEFQEYQKRQGKDVSGPGPSAFDILLASMKENDAFDGVISGVAAGLLDMGSRERGSVLSTARRNMKFLDNPKMQACLRASDLTLRLEDLKKNPKGVSLFVVLPSRHMKSHARWMRLLLNLLIARLEADPEPAANEHPVLAICDEFPVLGHMAVLESAVGYMAGFGLKLWAILQDLSQLKRHYPDSWETFLGNAGTLQVFANSDQTTLEFVSRRLGEIEVTRTSRNQSKTTTETLADISDFEKVQKNKQGGAVQRAIGAWDFHHDTVTRSQSTAEAETETLTIQKTALITPDELRRIFARKTGLQIVSLSDERPMILLRSPYYEDPYFEGKYDPLT
ncbi:MAG: type IV secretory system conjugative DNA transfer family protein [Pseudomonadota bacterium]